MLIQITNNCDMGCPHCLQDSKVGDFHMSMDTFMNALKFGKYMMNFRYNISGGEPTSHPMFAEMMDALSEHLHKNSFAGLKYLGIPAKYPSYTIESNGSFTKNPVIVKKMVEIVKDDMFEMLQICSIRGLYKNYDFISKYKPRIMSKFKPKVFVYQDKIRAMKSLGRASSNDDMLDEAKSNTYFMSCMNSSLLAIQSGTPEVFSINAFTREQTCKPLVDWKGDVHMSESCTCPSVGNVNTDEFIDIWKNMRKFRPCGRCHEYKKLVEYDNEKIKEVKRIFGIG